MIHWPSAWDHGCSVPPILSLQMLYSETKKRPPKKESNDTGPREQQQHP